MSFHVGQKVVCVRDAWEPSSCGYLPPLRPKAGCEYTIRAITLIDVGPSLQFHWLVNPPMRFTNGYLEPAFCSIGGDGVLNFRPIVEKKTDISVFTKLLTPTPQRRELVSSVNGEGINAR